MKPKLSERVRPNSEAAPWVLESIVVLEAQNEQLKLLLKEVTELWPYINCSCGRNQQRISDELREKIYKELKKNQNI